MLVDPDLLVNELALLEQLQLVYVSGRMRFVQYFFDDFNVLLVEVPDEGWFMFGYLIFEFPDQQDPGMLSIILFHHIMNETMTIVFGHLFFSFFFKVL